MKRGLIILFIFLFLVSYVHGEEWIVCRNSPNYKRVTQRDPIILEEDNLGKSRTISTLVRGVKDEQECIRTNSLDVKIKFATKGNTKGKLYFNDEKILSINKIPGFRRYLTNSYRGYYLIYDGISDINETNCELNEGENIITFEEDYYNLDLKDFYVLNGIYYNIEFDNGESFTTPHEIESLSCDGSIKSAIINANSNFNPIGCYIASRYQPGGSEADPDYHNSFVHNVSEIKIYVTKISDDSPEEQDNQQTDNSEATGHYCSNRTQIIFKLYQQNNSHAGLWNSSYEYAICYNEIFGKEYSNKNPHDCSENNKVLNLFYEDNSHAEVPSLSNYNIPVCYGDLKCHSINTNNGDDCEENEKIVASLSSETNAHVSAGDYPDYPIKICCSSISATANAYWANTKGEEIDEAYINDTVLLIINNTGLEAGTTKILKIYEDDLISDDFIRNITATVDIEGRLIGVWKITYEDFRRGHALLGDNDKFYFESEDLNIQSENMKINNYENDSQTQGVIISPIDKQVYFNEPSLIGLAENFTDPDDVLTINWSFDEPVKFNNAGTSYILTKNVTYTKKISKLKANKIKFVNSGQKTIELTVKNNRGEIVKREKINILILNQSAEREKQVFAYIDEPRNFRNIIGNISDGGSVPIDFSGKESYILEMNHSNKNYIIKCLYGACPNEIHTAKSSNIPIDISENKSLHSPELLFNWSLKKDNEQEELKFSKRGNETNSVKGIIRISKRGNYLIKLILGYEDISSEVVNEFSINLEGVSCNKTQGQFIDADGNSLGCSYGGDICCPDGETCDEEEGKCVPIPGREITTCVDYLTKEDCEGDSYGVSSKIDEKCGKDTLSPTGEPVKVECSCVWNNSANICDGNKRYIRIITNAEGNEISTQDIGNCTIRYNNNDDCSDGLLDISWTATWTWDNEIISKRKGNVFPYNEWDNYTCEGSYCYYDPHKNKEKCKDGSITVQCEYSLIPFFDIRNLLISVLILLGYLIVRRKSFDEKP